MTEIDAPALIPQEHVLLHQLNHRINNEFAATISVRNRYCCAFRQ